MAVGAADKAQANAPADHPRQSGEKKSHLIIRSGSLTTSNGLPLSLRNVDVDIVKKAPDPNAKDSASAQHSELIVHAGNAFIPNSGLSHLMQQKVQTGNLKDLKVSTDNGRVKITGTAHKGVPIPFSIEGPVSVTPDGDLRLEVKEEKAAKLPFTKIADMLGLTLPKMAGSSHPSKGIRFEQNALLVEPSSLWDFDVQGKVTAVSVEKDGLLLHFSEASAKPANKDQHTQTKSAENKKPAAGSKHHVLAAAATAKH